ncbi:unnamed protein product [Parajaminaea phylloscopi]
MSSLFDSLNFPSSSQLASSLGSSPSAETPKHTSHKARVFHSDRGSSSPEKAVAQAQHSTKSHHREQSPQVFWKHDTDETLVSNLLLQTSSNSSNVARGAALDGGKRHASGDELDWWLNRSNSAPRWPSRTGTAVPSRPDADSSKPYKRAKSLRTLSKASSTHSNTSSKSGGGPVASCSLRGLGSDGFRRHLSSSAALEQRATSASGRVGSRNTHPSAKRHGLLRGALPVKAILSDLTFQLHRDAHSLEVDSRHEDEDASHARREDALNGLHDLTKTSEVLLLQAHPMVPVPEGSRESSSTPQSKTEGSTGAPLRVGATPTRLGVSSWERTATFPPTGSPANSMTAAEHQSSGHSSLGRGVQVTDTRQPEEELLHGLDLDFETDLSFVEECAEEDQMFSDLVLSQLAIPEIATDADTEVMSGVVRSDPWAGRSTVESPVVSRSTAVLERSPVRMANATVTKVGSQPPPAIARLANELPGPRSVQATPLSSEATTSLGTWRSDKPTRSAQTAKRADEGCDDDASLGLSDLDTGEVEEIEKVMAACGY